CFGLRTGVATAMVDYGIGELVQGRVRETGVTPFYKWFAHDGVRGPNMATVYSDQGFGVRAPVVFYNRANEAGALLKPGDFDWKAIFANGVRWLHSGGIFSALSKTTSELVIEAMKAAREAGVVTSLDLNYREKLWKPQGGIQRAHEVLGAIVENVDVLIGNEEDLQKGLGFEGPEVATSAKSASSKLDTTVFLGMMEQVVKRFPKTKVVATTLREVHNTNAHSWSAVAWVNGASVQAPTAELKVLDRVGGGDGFAAGFIYGLLSGEAPQQAVNLGWAHGALLTTFPGDTTMATLDQVKQFAGGGSARIQR
ncbi:MAG TPA: PfkB family carbohydrate kinase, partial [Acidobacteriaceae bacterium]